MSIIHIAFYPSDWLAGTRGLSDTETGVYITLVARMYEMAGPIVRDDSRLARLCGCKTKTSFVTSLNHLISEGKIITSEEGLFNDRVQKEIQTAIEKSGKARAAAEARWDKKPNKNRARSEASASPKHMPQTCQSEPEPESHKKEDTSVSLSTSPPAIGEIAQAIQHFNAVADVVGWPKIQKTSPARRGALKARIRDVGGLEAWCEAITRASSSPQLTGQNNRGWRATFDWLAVAANFTKLMEGNYDERPKQNSDPSGTNHPRPGSPHHSLMAGFAQVADRYG
tara:strand:+ start:256 stop:1104 length:849 start_codon:yes stop_codon:yes gene_type:complete